VSWPGDELTLDGFLDGRVQVWQPRRGYRAATDPVLLAAAVPARPGDSVLELGCGAGVALICLGARVPVRATGLEVQAPYAELARRNLARNGQDALIVTGDLAAMPPALRTMVFDHVMANPPFYRADAASPAPDTGRDIAHREGAAGLAAWIDAGLRRLRPGGTLTLIHRTEALGRILAALAGRAGDICVLPLHPRDGRPAGRVIVQARKGRRGPLALLTGLILHTGTAHRADGDDYTPMARFVLRDMQPMVLRGGNGNFPQNPAAKD
jgi:tRNA1Val (adenine37-N6)-methyltransferase